jgi:dynactin complex subunit
MRQADRDKVNAIADAEHREELHQVSLQRQIDAERQTALLVEMMAQNTKLTETIKALTERVEALTIDVHRSVVKLPAE